MRSHKNTTRLTVKERVAKLNHEWDGTLWPSLVVAIEDLAQAAVKQALARRKARAK